MTGGVCDGGVKTRADGNEERVRPKQKGEEVKWKRRVDINIRVCCLLTGVRFGGEWKNGGHRPRGTNVLVTAREVFGRKGVCVKSRDQVWC